MPILGIDASRAVKKEKTGVEWYSYFLLRAMEKLTPDGWRVKCYMPSLEYKEAGPPELRRPGLPVSDSNWEWRVLKWPVERGWIQGRLSLEMLVYPPDVLFVPSRILPVVHPEKTVTTIHDTVFLTHPELYDPHDLWLQKHGLEFALKFARKIIVPSRATRDDLLRAGAREGQVIVIPHGVEIEYTEAEPLALQRLGLPLSDPYFLFIGRIERKKNILGLLHAFRSLDLTRGAKLVLAGPLGYGGQDVLQAIKTFKLEGRVIHLGYVERLDYLTLLKKAALLVLPSFGEGFGLPVLEAMAAAVPVVCSDLPALQEVGGNAVQYVDPRDPEDIARGIAAVFSNEMLQAEMVRRGKARVEEFTWERCARETWRVIKSL